MSARRIGACILIAVLLTAGCSESTRIQTSPPGARIYVDNVLVGVSPTVYTASRAELSKPHQCRAALGSRTDRAKVIAAWHSAAVYRGRFGHCRF